MGPSLLSVEFDDQHVGDGVRRRALVENRIEVQLSARPEDAAAIAAGHAAA